MGKPTDLVQGTVDLLIMKTIALEPLHGWAIAQRIQGKTGDIAALLARWPDSFAARPQRALPPVAEDNFAAEAFLARLPCCAAMSAARLSAAAARARRVNPMPRRGRGCALGRSGRAPRALGSVGAESAPRQGGGRRQAQGKAVVICGAA